MESSQVSSVESSGCPDTVQLLGDEGDSNISLVQKYILDAIVTIYVMYICLLTIPLTDAMLKKSCHELEYNNSICETLNEKRNQEYLNEVQRITKFYGLLMNIVGSLPGTNSSIDFHNFIRSTQAKRPLFGTRRRRFTAIRPPICSIDTEIVDFYKLPIPAAVSTIVASNFITSFGMKAPMIFALIGAGLTGLLQVWSVVDMDLPLYFNVIFQLPQAVAGK